VNTSLSVTSQDIVANNDGAVARQMATDPYTRSVPISSDTTTNDGDDDMECKYDDEEVCTSSEKNGIIHNESLLDTSMDISSLLDNLVDSENTGISTDHNNDTAHSDRNMDIQSTESPQEHKEDEDDMTSPMKERSDKQVRFNSPVISDTYLLSPIKEDSEPSSPSEKVMITFDYMKMVDERKAVYRMKDKEDKYAKLLCIPATLDGQALGYALIDQGASRSLIRKSKLKMIKTQHPWISIENHYVLSSSGKEIPVTHNVQVDLVSGTHQLGSVLFYVVDDTPEDDICCDMAIGRSTLALSPYSYIDTKNGCLYNPSTKEIIKCQSASTVVIDDRLNLLPEGEVNALSDAKLNKYLDKINKTGNQQKKILRLNAMISRRHDLPSSVRETLFHQLLECEHMYNIPVPRKSSRLEYYMYHVNSEGDTPNLEQEMLHQLQCLTQVEKNSKEEAQIIHQMFSMHVPGIVRKELHKENNLDDSKSVSAIRDDRKQSENMIIGKIQKDKPKDNPNSNTVKSPLKKTVYKMKNQSAKIQANHMPNKRSNLHLTSEHENTKIPDAQKSSKSHRGENDKIISLKGKVTLKNPKSPNQEKTISHDRSKLHLHDRTKINDNKNSPFLPLTQGKDKNKTYAQAASDGKDKGDHVREPKITTRRIDSLC
jgi:hypothetical protein